MALRPGRRLLMSSHFIPLPRSSMIKASSSGDHFDCFLAGDSAVCAGCSRFAGTPGPVLVKGGGAVTGAGPVVKIGGAVPGGGPGTDLGG